MSETTCSSRLRVLFVTPELKHYRVPVLRIIGQRDDIDLTVAHSSSPLTNGEMGFKEVIMRERRLGPLFLHDRKLLQMCNDHDVVIMMHYIQRLSFVRAALQRHRKYKLIYWGIGVKASQRSSFDSKGIGNAVRYWMARRADAVVFYSEYPVKKYVRRGVHRNQIFVANNTVEVVEDCHKEPRKDSILLVGTLNRSKRVAVLLKEYMAAYQANSNVPNLHIVGGGEDYQMCKRWVEDTGMRHKVHVHGPVYDGSRLEQLFKRSFACISPGQAGLSVLTSMGFGVPFVTATNAITGGEIFNITDGETGVLLKDDADLRSVIEDIAHNPDRYARMGERAKEHYRSLRRPEHMADGIISAINHVTKL